MAELTASAALVEAVYITDDGAPRERIGRCAMLAAGRLAREDLGRASPERPAAPEPPNACRCIESY